MTEYGAYQVQQAEKLDPCKTDDVYYLALWQDTTLIGYSMTRQESIEKLNRAGWTSKQIQHVMKVIEEDRNGDISWAAITQRLLNHEPIEYITGYDYFMNLKLHVSKDVLLPRPETEDLMALIFQHIPSENTVKASFLDIGTGSGCL